MDENKCKLVQGFPHDGQNVLEYDTVVVNTVQTARSILNVSIT